MASARLRLSGSIGAGRILGQGEPLVDFGAPAVFHEVVLTLALDTTTRDGSLALRRDGRLIDERVGDGTKAYAARLPVDVIDLLATQGLPIADIDLYGVAAGPGSFTGLRIGIATIQGLALVHDKPVAAVSALDALAEVGSAGVGPSGTLIGVWMDGGRQQVFSALYACSSPGVVAPLDEPRAESPGQALARWADRAASRSWIFVGDGCLLYRDLIEAAGWEAALVDPTPPLASQIAAMADRAAAAGKAGLPGAIRPLYVRRSDAELTRDRRAEESRRER